jgi:hypothetical protein
MELYLTGKAETDLITRAKAGEDCIRLCLPAGYYHIDYGENTVKYMGTGDEASHISFESGNRNRFCLSVTEDYYPLQYTVWVSAEGGGWTKLEGMENVPGTELAKWVAAIGGTYSAGTDFSQQKRWKITWRWPERANRSDADTLLLMCATENGMKWEGDVPSGFSTKENLQILLQIDQTH